MKAKINWCEFIISFAVLMFLFCCMIIAKEGGKRPEALLDCGGQHYMAERGVLRCG